MNDGLIVDCWSVMKISCSNAVSVGYIQIPCSNVVKRVARIKIPSSDVVSACFVSRFPAVTL